MSAAVSAYWHATRPYRTLDVEGGCEGEHYYALSANDLAPWQHATCCDVCRRYVQLGPHNTTEGSQFCASRCQPTHNWCPPCDTPADDERLAGWYSWVAWQREPVAPVEEHPEGCRLPMCVSEGGRIRGRVIG